MFEFSVIIFATSPLTAIELVFKFYKKFDKLPLKTERTDFSSVNSINCIIHLVWPMITLKINFLVNMSMH